DRVPPRRGHGGSDGLQPDWPCPLAGLRRGRGPPASPRRDSPPVRKPGPGASRFSVPGTKRSWKILILENGKFGGGDTRPIVPPWQREKSVKIMNSLAASRHP